MDRVFESGASGTPPSAPVSPSSGYPTAGSPVGGIPPTKPGPWWYHMVTEELRNVVVAAGLTPDHTAVNQLGAAIAGLISTGAAPAGVVVYVAKSAAPAGYLKANGAAISRATYAALFAAIGTTFGAGDGSTTFNLPDLRGEFLRGWDDGRGVDSGRTLGSAQADEIKSHTHTVPGSPSGSGYTGAPSSTTNGLWESSSTGGAETRPRNIALLACIKY